MRISQSFSAFSVGEHTRTEDVDRFGLLNGAHESPDQRGKNASCWQWRFNFDSITCTRNVYVVPYHHGVFDSAAVPQEQPHTICGCVQAKISSIRAIRWSCRGKRSFYKRTMDCFPCILAIPHTECVVRVLLQLSAAVSFDSDICL